NFISTVLRAIGDSKSPLVFVFIAVLLNAALDPLFIAGFDMGVNGAALATILSQGAAFAYGLYFVLKNKLAPFQLPSLPKWEEVALILNLGIPAGLQMAVISVGSAAIMSVVTKFGSSVVGGYGAAQRLSSTIMLPAQSLGTSVNSMAGQNIGVNDWMRVKQIMKNGLLYNVLFMCAIGLAVLLFTESLVRLFIQDQTSVTFASDYLRIMVFCFPFLGINFVLNGIVRASGAMYQVLFLNIISFWMLSFPLAWIFSVFMDERGIAVGIGLSFIASSLVAATYYRYGKWSQKELFKGHYTNESTMKLKKRNKIIIKVLGVIIGIIVLLVVISLYTHKDNVKNSSIAEHIFTKRCEKHRPLVTKYAKAYDMEEYI